MPHMSQNDDFKNIKDIFAKKIQKKAPAYEWQDLALKIIQELNIPNFKRSSVFKICKNNDKQFIVNCLNDTKELCHTGDKWKYFFKLINIQKIKK